jgi:hypothetical protein
MNGFGSRWVCPSSHLVNHRFEQSALSSPGAIDLVSQQHVREDRTADVRSSRVDGSSTA